MRSRIALGAVALILAAQPALAQKTIAYLTDNTSAKYATHDVNIIAALGSAGITTVDGVTIPGLNYTIVEYQAGAEPDPITEDLLYVSETVASGAPKYHTDDLTAIIMNEAVLYDNNEPAKTEMYFSTGQAQPVDQDFFLVTDNSHPITSIWTVGTVLEMWRDGAAENPRIGYMTGTIATAVTVLATNPADTSQPCLAVADAGATGFIAPSGGFPQGVVDPAPGRRVCLGFMNNCMDEPTSAGIILLQRTVQWAIGDPVTADFGGVQPGAVASATRSFGASSYVLGQPLNVTIDIVHQNNSNPLVVEETFPAGWSVLSVSDSGTTAGNTITWNINFTADTALTYELMPKGGMNKVGNFSGLTRDTGAVEIPVGGNPWIALTGVKPIVFIQGSAGGGEAHDGTLKAVWGTDGFTSPSPVIDVGGLGYPILAIGENDAEEATSFTLQDGVMAFVSQSCNSGSVAFHTKDPIPLIQGETALFNFDAGAPYRCEAFFSAGQAGRGGPPVRTAFNIVNTGHPITAIWSAGNLEVWRDQGNGPQIGVMTPAMNPAVTILAEDPGSAGDPCLAVAESGVQFDNATVPAEHIPYVTPARRACLGYHDNTMIHPTQDGLYLAQRLAQWMIGDAVTAGTVAPNAPTDLGAVVATASWVQVSWTDASDNENGFVISRLTSGTTTAVDVGQVRDGATSFLDQTADFGNTYTYFVRAFNPAGENESDPGVTIPVEPRLDSKNWHLYR